VRGEGGGVPWRGGWGRGKRELRRAEACLGPMEALCRAFPRGQNLQPISSSDHFPARNRLQPKSVRIQAGIGIHTARGSAPERGAEVGPEASLWGRPARLL